MATTKIKHDLEAIIGSYYVVTATGGAILLSKAPSGAEILQSILVGHIPWTQWWQIPALLIPTALILGLWFNTKTGNDFLFYSLIAVAVTTSVQIMGVYLVFATLVIPGIASHGYPPLARNPMSLMIATLGYFIGLLASLLFDLPGSPAIVWSITLVAVIFYVFRKGITLTMGDFFIRSNLIGRIRELEKENSRLNDQLAPRPPVLVKKIAPTKSTGRQLGVMPQL